MPDDDAAKEAISGLNDSELDSRTIVVKEAEERGSRPRRNNFGGGGGGGYNSNRGGAAAALHHKTLRDHALGSYRSMLHAVAKDPAMLLFLNNQQNKKNAPNENFAREIMELFTLGTGNYTEQDIKEAARAFTGWKTNLKGDFVKVAKQHDNGIKNFMGKSGNWDGEDIIDMILEERQTAYFLCEKVYKHFVNDQDIDHEIVSSLSKVFYEKPLSMKEFKGKRLIIIQLSGGNDGLNTLVPYRNDLYYKARPSLKHEASQLLQITDEAAFHPALSFFREAYQN
ncbi:unnamed protein product, partial [Cyprideis torosa]